MNFKMINVSKGNSIIVKSIMNYTVLNVSMELKQ